MSCAAILNGTLRVKDCSVFPYLDAKVAREHLVSDVSITAGKVKVTTDKGISDLFDAVVLTMPVPQILQLQGDIQALIGLYIYFI